MHVENVILILIWGGGVTQHTLRHTIAKCDLCSERIAPTKGSTQPLADGAAVLQDSS